VKWSTAQHVFQPQGDRPWARHSATKPCVLVRNDGTPRVFAGFRDDSGVSRLGYVDLDPEDPRRVIGVSQKPLLDVGNPGMFDDNGVVPAEVLRHAGRIYLYYEGYQLGVNVKFTSFSGLAVSDDDGDTFKRLSSVPVMDRVESESLIRVVGSVLVESDCWRTWYTAGSTFQEAHGDHRPCYDMRYLSSSTGHDYRGLGRICLEPRPPFEYRLGRPHVRRVGKHYWMLFSAADRRTGYRLGFARSVDGVTWTRKDESLEIFPSGDEWDREMQAYPFLFQIGPRILVVYNGNGYGKTGFGITELLQE
jgi:hypothetical protein